MADGLIIAGIEVPIREHHTATQRYLPVGGSVDILMHGGKTKKLTHWRKYQTSIDVEGWIPAALGGVEWGAAFDLHCIAPRTVGDASPVITIPRAYRSDGDFAPSAGGYVGPDLIPAPVSIAAGVATVAPVPGATRYVVQYYPILTVIADPPEYTSETTPGGYRWTLAATEESASLLGI
jgi:hypothetical protein